MRMSFRGNSLTVIAVAINRTDLMKIHALQFCAALFCGIFFPTAMAGEGVYTYRDPVFPDKSLSLNFRDDVFQIADVGMEMSSCVHEDEYFCIISDGFFIHIPKNGISFKRKWKIGNIEYRNENEQTVSVWGRSISVYRIHGQRGKMKIIYLYSVESGLMGFSFLDSKTGAKALYLLDAECGFGAFQGCGKSR